MLLSVNSIEKRYEEDSIFNSVSFNIDEGQKIALVGNNGSGKSTILKILANLENPDFGEVKLSKGRSVAYLPQEIIDINKTGIEYISQDTDLKLHQFISILNGFGLTEKIANQNLNTMSGGQRTKILLTKFLLNKADILLLDEPTNNLDIESILWLEQFLKNSKKAMIIVSHDIVFLDNITNKVFKLEDENLSIEGGTYGDYIKRKEKEFERDMSLWKQYTAEVKRLEANISSIQKRSEEIDKTDVDDKDKIAAGARRDKASGVQKNSKIIKRKLSKMEKVEKPFETEPLVLEIHPKNTEASIEIDIKDLVSGYSDGVKVGPFSSRVVLKNKICFLGENGAGKSTILKTIYGDLKEIEGEVNITEGVKFGDLMQQHERADRNENVFNFFQNQTKFDLEKTTNALKKVGFNEKSMKHKISTISSGMRARLLFAIFSATGVNVLILDEPTNHLDMDAVRALKDLLKRYMGIVILVSHNRWFLEGLEIDFYYNVENGAVKKIDDFDEYLDSIKKRAEQMVTKLKRHLNF